MNSYLLRSGGFDECVRSGAAFGGVFLHHVLEELLRRKMGDYADSILTPWRFEEIKSYFEEVIQFKFNYFDEKYGNISIPCAGSPDVPDIGLEDGYLVLSRFPQDCILSNDRREDINNGVFVPVFDKIYDLIREGMEGMRQSKVLHLTMHASDN